jgi:hypothetical protein
MTSFINVQNLSNNIKIKPIWFHHSKVHSLKKNDLSNFVQSHRHCLLSLFYYCCILVMKGSLKPMNLTT